jgi:hypothetical protein
MAIISNSGSDFLVSANLSSSVVEKPSQLSSHTGSKFSGHRNHPDLIPWGLPDTVAE